MTTRLEMQIYADVADLVAEIGKIPRDRISGDATIDGQLGMPSVAFVELQVAIEDRYDIELDLITMVELNRFDEIVKYISRVVANKPG